MANDRSQNQPGSVDEGKRTDRGQDGRTGGKVSKGGSMNEDRRSEDESEDIQASAGDKEMGQGNTRKSGGRVGQPNTGDQSEEDDQREGNKGGKR